MEWIRCTLGDVITLQRGFDLPERNRQSGNVPIISSSGITGYHNIAKVPGPGVVTGRYGTLGEVFYIKKAFWPLNTTLFVRDFKGNHPQFISYFLRTLNLAQQNAAGAVPGVNRNALHLLPVQIPPLSIQRKIAAILSSYDEMIENNTHRIAILEETAQMLYHEWFVEFHFPGYEGVNMVDSELGLIPEGWEISNLGNIAYEVRRGINPDAIDPETPYLGLEHLPRKSIALSEWGTAKEVQSTKLIFKKDEILFGKIRPYLHKVVVAPLDGVCSSDTIVISPRSEEYFTPLLCCVSGEDFVSYASKTAQGTQMPRANWNVLAEYPLVLPPKPIMTRFDQTIRDSVATIHNLTFRNRNLRRTRDMLLPKLVSGEIDVSSWVEGEGNEEEGVQELAVSGAGTAGVYDVPGRAMHKVAESGPVEPIKVDELEWRSLWE